MDGKLYVDLSCCYIETSICENNFFSFQSSQIPIALAGSSSNNRAKRRIPEKGISKTTNCYNRLWKAKKNKNCETVVITPYSTVFPKHILTPYCSILVPSCYWIPKKRPHV